MSVYPVLERNIHNKGFDISVISFLLGITDKSFLDKLNGNSSFYFDEVILIRDNFFPDCSLQELFIKK